MKRNNTMKLFMRPLHPSSQTFCESNYKRKVTMSLLIVPLMHICAMIDLLLAAKILREI